MSELALFEKQLQPLSTEFADVLPASIPAERLIRTVLVSCQRNPKLLQPHLRATLMQSAMTSAVLGLEVDGVTGQGFLIPFAGKNPCVQFIPGYKGYNTIAARSGYTINGAVFREGDEIDYMEGSAGFVNHKRKLGGESSRKILGAWATATAEGRAPIVALLSIDELMQIKGKSAGAKKSDSPWNDPGIGFVAMCEKSAKRRLARSVPLNTYNLAAAMESQQDIGRPCHINKKAELVVDGAEIMPRDDAPPSAESLTTFDQFQLNWNGQIKIFPTIEQWMSALDLGITTLSGKAQAITIFYEANNGEIERIRAINIDAGEWAKDKFAAAMNIGGAQ